jgi:hypothetical protein
MSNNLKIFCPVCKKRGTELVFKPESEIVNCLVCKEKLILKTVLIDKYSVSKKESGWQYKIFAHRTDETPTLIKISFDNQVDLKENELITVVSFRGKKLGLANFNKNSWQTAGRENISIRKDNLTKYLRAVVLALILLQGYLFIQYLNENKNAALIAFLIIILIVLLPIVLMFFEGSLNEKSDLKSKLSWLR